jgi:hypothetical protein
MTHIINISSSLETYKNFTTDLTHNKCKLEKLCKLFDKIKPFKISFSKMLDIGKIMKLNYEIFVDNDIKQCVDYSFGFNSFYEQVDHLKNIIDSGKINMCSFIETTDTTIEEDAEEPKKKNLRIEKNIKNTNSIHPISPPRQINRKSPPRQINRMIPIIRMQNLHRKMLQNLKTYIIPLMKPL